LTARPLGSATDGVLVDERSAELRNSKIRFALSEMSIHERQSNSVIGF